MRWQRVRVAQRPVALPVQHHLRFGLQFSGEALAKGGHRQVARERQLFQRRRHVIGIKQGLARLVLLQAIQCKGFLGLFQLVQRVKPDPQA